MHKRKSRSLETDMKKILYESDTTKFIRELLENKPEVIADQKKARAMWWDKTLDLKELRRKRESEVARTSYVYYDTAPGPGEKK
jgi:hypothetical protein